MKTLYTAHATSLAGRDGTVKTDDGTIDLRLGRPGSSDAGTNPEQLFACGYSACFGSAVAHVAKAKGTALGEVKIEASVMLNQGDGGFSIAVVLNAILQGVEEEQARMLVQEAHTVCPYSKATRGNIPVELQVNGAKIAS